MVIDLGKLQSTLQKRQSQTRKLAGGTQAAVMLLIFRKGGEDCILFTRRTQKVEHHKGQISLPGGAKDPEDEDLIDTALRENQEEMGIAPADVKVLGVLDDVATNTGFIITPFVGVIPYPYAFQPFDEEIEEVIEAPVSALIANRQPWQGLPFTPRGSGIRWQFEYNGHIIWGATAQIIDQFLGLLASFIGELRKGGERVPPSQR